jgi:hypothetical protein
MRKIILRVQGGFANRLRAIVSAVLWAQDIDATLEIFWPVEVGHMPCKLDDLIDSRSIDLLTYVHNGYLSRAHQILNADDMRTVMSMGEEIRIESYSEFHPDLIARSVRGLEALRKIRVMKYLEDIAETFSLVREKPVGIHIRRTDHVKCIKASPLEAFMECVKGVLEERCDTKFYLATDEIAVKNMFISRWGDAVVSPITSLGRRSVEQQQNGIIEWLLLQKCSKIYASAGSSFSEMAALRAGIPLVHV